jgi:hypothetical protein
MRIRHDALFDLGIAVRRRIHIELELYHDALIELDIVGIGSELQMDLPTVPFDERGSHLAFECFVLLLRFYVEIHL